MEFDENGLSVGDQILPILTLSGKGLKCAVIYQAMQIALKEKIENAEQPYASLNAG